MRGHFSLHYRKITVNPCVWFPEDFMRALASKQESDGPSPYLVEWKWNQPSEIPESIYKAWESARHLTSNILCCLFPDALHQMILAFAFPKWLLLEVRGCNLKCPECAPPIGVKSSTNFFSEFLDPEEGDFQKLFPLPWEPHREAMLSIACRDAKWADDVYGGLYVTDFGYPLFIGILCKAVRSPETISQAKFGMLTFEECESSPNACLTKRNRSTSQVIQESISCYPTSVLLTNERRTGGPLKCAGTCAIHGGWTVAFQNNIAFQDDLLSEDLHDLLAIAYSYSPTKLAKYKNPIAQGEGSRADKRPHV